MGAAISYAPGSIAAFGPERSTRGRWQFMEKQQDTSSNMPVPLLDVTEPCQDSADALDAVLCLFSAKAAADGLAVVDDPAASERKGWIAVHPRMTNE